MNKTESTTVDVLIARIETHPDEFFKREAVASYDGEKILAHTKWRRITTSLMVDETASEQNLWINLFSQEERQRFRAAFYKAVRAELDTQIMRVVLGEDPLKFDPDGQRVEAMKASQAAQMTRAQAIYQKYQGGMGMGMPGGTGVASALNTQSLSGPAMTIGYGQALQNTLGAVGVELEDMKHKYETQVRILEKKNKTLAARAQEWFSK